MFLTEEVRIEKALSSSCLIGTLTLTLSLTLTQVRIEKALSSFRLIGTLLFIGAFYLILHPIAALFSFIAGLHRLAPNSKLIRAHRLRQGGVGLASGRAPQAPGQDVSQSKARAALAE